MRKSVVMFENLLDPVIMFFALGLGAGILKSDLKLPQALYDTLSIYLLVTIGLKGGIALSSTNISQNIWQLTSPIVLGIMLPLIAYPILKRIGRLNIYDSAAIAAHYGSVSAITFAVVVSFLEERNISYEQYATVLLVLMEVPAILIGIFIVRFKVSNGEVPWSKLLHDVFLGKSVYLLLGGLLIGYFCDQSRLDPIKGLFITPFKGMLAFFLLEMGIIASSQLKELRKTGVFLVVFGIGFPLLASVIGAGIGKMFGLSFGGTVILSTLSASASYIAAPAAIRIAIPQANPTLYLTSALGITFPFNIIVGIPLYFEFVKLLFP